MKSWFWYNFSLMNPKHLKTGSHFSGVLGMCSMLLDRSSDLRLSAKTPLDQLCEQTADCGICSVSKKVLNGFLIKKHVESIIYSHSIVKLLSGMTIRSIKDVLAMPLRQMHQLLRGNLQLPSTQLFHP